MLKKIKINYNKMLAKVALLCQMTNDIYKNILKIKQYSVIIKGTHRDIVRQNTWIQFNSVPSFIV